MTGRTSRRVDADRSHDINGDANVVALNNRA